MVPQNRYVKSKYLPMVLSLASTASNRQFIWSALLHSRYLWLLPIYSVMMSTKGLQILPGHFISVTLNENRNISLSDTCFWKLRQHILRLRLPYILWKPVCRNITLRTQHLPYKAYLWHRLPTLNENRNISLSDTCFWKLTSRIHRDDYASTVCYTNYLIEDINLLLSQIANAKIPLKSLKIFVPKTRQQ